ncbi:Type 1 glutamine amidotransferase-like domain-containing protein [Chitinimonas lacunae]|uniref:Type 1 glutamine amidotransferase-like domain-containing protein n=1 Tax=Chitinimonas lacunae TaxID=1963018 RepID=A0ABV8MUT2_9NEIS
MAARQLFVLGGGGFLMEKSPLLDQYFLALTGQPRPRVCFLAQAGGEAPEQLLRFYSAHARYDCRPSHLSLFRPHTADLTGFLLEQDAIFVGGGNTRSMLALWREWGIDQALRQAYEAGIVLGGISAGMICWFEQGLTDSVPGALRPLAGLGLLAGGACPHYDGEAERRPSLRQLVADGRMPTSWAADDSAALHFVDGCFERAVTSREKARAWQVSRDPTAPQGVLETALPTTLLTLD